MGRRIPEHVNDARPGKSNLHVHNSMRLYGISKFSIGVISFLPDVSLPNLRRVELDLILKYEPGLNMTDVATGQTGGRPAKAVLVTNKVTGKVLEFPSVRSCARHFNVNHSSVLRAIKYHYTFLGTYLVQFK